MEDAVGDIVNRIPRPEFLSRRLSTVNSLSLRDLFEENNPSSQPESNQINNRNKTMALASLSRRLSAVNSLSLRDILEETHPSSQPEPNHHHNKNKTITLAAVLARSNPTSPPPSSSSTRTLLDIIEDENQLFHPTDTESIAQRVNWKSFKDRLILRRATSAFSEPPNQTLEIESPTTPRVSLMSLLERTDRMGEMEEEERKSTAVIATEEVEKEESVDDEVGEEMVHVCCVCMVRHKGAAFIPCGHTFCRLCSRELWVSRGNCPLCNGFILEILDIF